MEARRRSWERRWWEKAGTEFFWYAAEPPRQLTRLLESQSLPPGAALDIGCGNGVFTSYLSQWFSLAVGLDLVFQPLSRAKVEFADVDGASSFVQAAVPFLPIRDSSCALVFDRDCLRNIPWSLWTGYFGETARVLKPSGILQILFPDKRKKPILASSRLRAIAKGPAARRSRGGPRVLSAAMVQPLLPADLSVIREDRFLFRVRSGNLHPFTELVVRKTGP
jgi:SAM-dependent methyltransferase